MQQTDALIQPRRAEAFDHRQQLRRRQAEFGFLAAGISPLARCQRRQTHAQTDLWRDLEFGRLLDHQLHFGFFLDHDKYVVTELLPHQRQLDKFAVFVTVADDGAALRRQRQHGHQFRLGAGFQADGDVLRGDDVFHHRFLLVDLDRVQRGVGALVFQARDIGVKGTSQLAHAVLQDVREAHQQRQRQTAGTQFIELFVEVNRRALRAIRAHLDTTLVIDREITRAPMANAVDATAVRYGPLAAVIFTCASCRHRCLPCWR